MPTLIATSFLTFLAFSATAQQGAGPLSPSVELPAELARVLTDYESAYRAGGAELAALFAEDGFVLSGGRPPIRGRAAIADYFGGGRGPLALRAIAYEISRSVAYIIGGYAEKHGDPDAGKFTLTLQKGPGGRWFIFSDMDNSNRPPPPPVLTGVWRLDPGESRMIGGPPARDIVWTWTVDHQDPEIAVTVAVEDDQGPRQFSFSCTTDGQECVNELPGEVRRSTAMWEWAVLVMRTSAVTRGGEFTAVDCIQMMDNRQTLVLDRTVSDTLGERRVKQVFRRTR